MRNLSGNWKWEPNFETSSRSACKVQHECDPHVRCLGRTSAFSGIRMFGISFRRSNWTWTWNMAAKITCCTRLKFIDVCGAGLRPALNQQALRVWEARLGLLFAIRCLGRYWSVFGSYLGALSQSHGLTGHANIHCPASQVAFVLQCISHFTVQILPA